MNKRIENWTITFLQFNKLRNLGIPYRYAYHYYDASYRWNVVQLDILDMDKAKELEPYWLD